MNEGTIAALSTAPGRGAISIIRMSGEKSHRILSACFTPLSGTALEHAKLTLGNFSYGDLRDKAMAVVFNAPRSYTGEDVAELHLHGSVELAARVLKALVSLGARPAEPGEFTRRAFLNGKVGLNEAEAVADLINSESLSQIKAAYSALTGETSKEIKAIYNELVDVVSSFDAAIDYPEEDVEEMLASEGSERTEKIREKLKELADSYLCGAKIREGVRVALIGEPNAGKSSLMNRLLGRDRAIVTAVPGTTRDTIEESYEHKGMLFVLVDTAGIHETADEVEKEGIKRSMDELEKADIIVRLAPEGGVRPKAAGEKVLDITTKCDLKRGEHLNVSSVTLEGIDELKEVLYDKAGLKVPASSALTNARQYALVLKAIKGAEEALEAFRSGAHIDVALIGLKEALSSVGEITGAAASDDVLDAIFSKFCVGK